MWMSLPAICRLLPTTSISMSPARPEVEEVEDSEEQGDAEQPPQGYEQQRSENEAHPSLPASLRGEAASA